MIKHALAALVLLAGPASAQSYEEWPGWQKENREALAKIIEGGDEQTLHVGEQLAELFDRVMGQIDEGAAAKKAEYEQKAAQGDAAAAGTIVKIGRFANAKKSYWEGDLARRVLRDVAQQVGRCAAVAKLGTRFGPEDFRAAIMANAIDKEANLKDLEATMKDEAADACPSAATKAKNFEASGREIAAKAKAFFKGTNDEKAAEGIVDAIVARIEDADQAVRQEAAREKVAAIQAEMAGTISSAELALEKGRLEAARDLHRAYLWGNVFSIKLHDKLGGAVPSYLREDWAGSVTRDEYLADLAVDPVKGAWSKTIAKGKKNLSEPLKEDGGF